MHNSILRTKRETKRDKALWWKVMYKQLCMWWKRDHLKLFPRCITYHTVSRHQRRRKLQIQGQRDEDSGGSREKTDKSETQKLNIKIRKKRLTRPRTHTMLGMMPARTYQSMKREEDSVSSICNTCQKQWWHPLRKAIQQRLNDDTSRRTREPVAPKTPRSVRKKTKPKRYENQSWSNPG